VAFKVQTQEARRSTQPLIHLATLCAYLLLTVVMTWPLVAQWTMAIPGDSFDGWQNYWNQWWVKVALVDRQQTPFRTDLLYYPTGVDLYFHTLNPFNGATTLPIQLSLGLIQAYNSVVLLSWVLAGYGVYLLVLWLLHADAIDDRIPVTSHLAAFIAGVIFTFAPFHMAHLLGHMQVMSLEWIPFYVLYLLRATRQQRTGQSWWRSALWAGFFLTLTGLCDWYFVLYLFFFTGLVLGAEVLVDTPFKRRTNSGRSYTGVTVRRLTDLSIGRPGRWVRRFSAVLPSIVAGGLMLLLLSPLLIPMIRAAQQFSFMVRPTSDLYILSASVLDFLIPNRLHTLFRPASFTWPGNQIAPISERTIAIGYTALALALITLWRRRSPGEPKATVRSPSFWLVSALFFFMLALGPTWHGGNITAAMIPQEETTSTSWTLFGLLNATIPFMRISRSVSRYALMVQLSVAVLAGMGTAQVLRRTVADNPGPRLKVVTLLPPLLLATALLSATLFESWVAPFPMSPPDTPAVYARLPEILPNLSSSGAVLNLPLNYDRPGYLLYQTVHQQPLTVAYISRDDPRTLTERVPLLQHFRHLGPDIIAGDPTTVGLTILQDLGVEAVVLDRYKMPGGQEREYTEALAHSLFAEESARYEDDRITIYSVPTVGQPQPYLMLGARHWGPLRMGEDGNRRRLVGQQNAKLHLQHGSAGQQLRLRYRSVTEGSLELFNFDGTNQWQTLPPAPDGAEVTLVLADDRGLSLQASTADGVWIEAVTLLDEES